MQRSGGGQRPMLQLLQLFPAEQHRPLRFNLIQCDSAAALAAIKSGSGIAAAHAANADARSSPDILADLCAHGDEFVAATGGGGGRGNRTFASGGNRSPRKVETGAAGGIAKSVTGVIVSMLLCVTRTVAHVRVGAAADSRRRPGDTPLAAAAAE
jgi:hypothetical protein